MMNGMDDHQSPALQYSLQSTVFYSLQSTVCMWYMYYTTAVGGTPPSNLLHATCKTTTFLTQVEYTCTCRPASCHAFYLFI